MPATPTDFVYPPPKRVRFSGDVKAVIIPSKAAMYGEKDVLFYRQSQLDRWRSLALQGKVDEI